ncbi:hypothetical protein BCR43DRAFT_498717 [Syncephalastrum racemosum]|uniref:SigF-like NTF2-like domain-containing protein n=1 Tax=Syncephalastrum racemosum TaxID=13706 RepID=A0A1X2H1C6_SYNRA|nr:hypothetical protein BCR43DRAFT_498717 [Syncephalastrum racemosum]
MATATITETTATSSSTIKEPFITLLPQPIPPQEQQQQRLVPSSSTTTMASTSASTAVALLPAPLDPYEEIIQYIVCNLFSFNLDRQQRVLDHFYFEDAKYTSPLISTEGTENIRRVLLVWKALNRSAPTVTNICFDGGNTCVVHLTQSLIPRVLPRFLFRSPLISLPVVVTLHFEQVWPGSGMVKVKHHEEHWTADGLVQAIPFFASWYDRFIRVTTGRLLSAVGALACTATDTAQLLTARDKEIEYARQTLAFRQRMRKDSGCSSMDTAASSLNKK